MLNNKRNKKCVTLEDMPEMCDVKQLQHVYKDPRLLLIDLRQPGKFRGGPPISQEISTTYHQGHILLALNLNLQNSKTVKDVEEEIRFGSNSAGGTFVATLALAITSGFHFLFYSQDDTNKKLTDAIASVCFEYEGKDLKFLKERVHWLEGGYNAIYKNSSLRKFCADTKSLLGHEEELEEHEYSAVLPHLFVGGAICSDAQFSELNRLGVKHIINVSNIDRTREGFKCTFIFANDDQNETISRLFHQVANLIEESEKKGAGVFIHCQRGLSRSPTLIMAYLMIKKNFSLREAFELVRQKRPNIGPRSNFMTELCKLERELIPEKNNDFVYSLPMQVYELSSMRCVKYEDSMQFLLAPKKQTRLGRCCAVLRATF
mmetsp:Transcript_89217/g.133749  ORF Transcript_89217/g.133749 Transcript_89217/m.133749 type:complete len:375 (+) Transcript_89217:15-1139(+)